jgi:hypothetical protein
MTLESLEAQKRDDLGKSLGAQDTLEASISITDDLG